MTERQEQMIYDEGYRKGYEKGKADAVSVVRCKECKHYDDGDCEHPCSEVGDSPLLVKADDFCSYGERSDT